MSFIDTDVAIIGAGTAGLAAERSARRAGARTQLIDDQFSGTTCARVGCMPSKLLIAAAHSAQEVRRAPTFGIRSGGPLIDGAAVMLRVQRERDHFVAETCKSIDEIPQGIRLQARARFESATSLLLSNGDRVSYKAVVIATGARPQIPEMFRDCGDRVLTHETIFDLTDLPSSLAVVGAGPLGLELAQAFARLGVCVEVFDEAQTLAGLHDEEVAKALLSILGREFAIRLGTKLSARLEDDRVALSWNGAHTGEGKFDRVLLASGRSSELKDLNLASTGLALDKHGVPDFDHRTLQCGAMPIFVAGDVTAYRPVLHEAVWEGSIAGCNAASYPHSSGLRRSTALSIMFTDPPVAIVGEPMTDELILGSASYADQGRSRIEARNDGCAQFYARREDGAIVGATLCIPGAEHIAHLLTWAVERGETAKSLLDLPMYHPTLEEGIKSALREICKQVEVPANADRDDSAFPGG